MRKARHSNFPPYLLICWLLKYSLTSLSQSDFHQQPFVQAGNIRNWIANIEISSAKLFYSFVPSCFSINILWNLLTMSNPDLNNFTLRILFMLLMESWKNLTKLFSWKSFKNKKKHVQSTSAKYLHFIFSSRYIVATASAC